MDLPAALELGDSELVSFVGAGGKKTAMAHLLAAANERGLRAAYTTTTHMPPPADVPLTVADDLRDVDVTASGTESIALAREWVENPSRADRKVRGFAPSTVDALFDRGALDWVLVKADGARRREFKAPGPDEPVIPGASTRVVTVASVRAVGAPLDESTVHRPERVAAITGLERGDHITADVMGAVLASDDGGCKGVPSDATVIPLVNKADTPALRETAREVVEAALSTSDRFDRGYVCSFETDALVVVER